MTTADNPIDSRALTQAVANLLNAPAQMAATLVGSLTNARSGGCTIPPPCWEPRPAGRCALTLPPGCTGTMRVHVSNCDWGRRVVGITALGKLAGWLAFQPTTLVIGPQERATFVVKVHVPDGVEPGETLAGPVLVRGCVDHFVRLEVAVAECAGVTCCDISLDDCPDHIHHWYDHFYCPRPCRDFRTQDIRNG